MARNARTTIGSNCSPASFAISTRAVEAFTAWPYERRVVMASKVSATATMRAPKQICSPAKP